MTKMGGLVKLVVLGESTGLVLGMGRLVSLDLVVRRSANLVLVPVEAKRLETRGEVFRSVWYGVHKD